MNAEKAREYFSAYYEDALEAGMRQTFEQRLRGDKSLQAEYRAFQYSMEELEALKFEEIPLPLYLNDRIQAKLEESNAPQKNKRGVLFYLPRFVMASAAAVAIAFAAKAILRPVQSTTVQSSIIGGADSPSPAWPPETLFIGTQGSITQLHYSSATDHVLRIRDENGNELKQYSLPGGEVLKTDLQNQNPAASIFQIQVSDDGPDEYVAVPGRSNSVSGDQRGTVMDFIKALAERYREPIIFDGINGSEPLAWSLSEPDPKAASDKAFQGSDLTDSVTSTGVLSISEKK
jgi:hypothetical protein